jgi:hypothetical protein
MKSSFKILFILFFFFINFIGCNPCGSGVDKALPFFDVQNIRNIYNAKSTGIQSKIDEEISLKDYRLIINLDVKFYASTFKSNGFSTFACSPPESGYKGTNEKIDYIKISCDKPFDDKHNANTSLNDLTIIYDYTQSSSVETLENYLKKASYAPSMSSLSLTFSTPPSKKQSLTFTVEYALTNGEKYTAKTLPVIIY